MKNVLRALMAVIALALPLLALPGAAAAQPSGPIPKDIGYEPRLGASAPLDVELIDEAGQPARLGAYFRSNRPVILVLAYYECPMLCSMVLNGLTDTLKAVRLTPGEDFEVVVVSIDPADTPGRAHAKKASYMRVYGRPGAEQAFHFMTGSEPSVRRVADAVGFKYAYDPVGRQFAHPAGVVLLTGGGVISRYLYGADFEPRDLRLGLVEAANGTIGSVTDRLMLLCFHYDLSRGRYGAIALTSLRAGGAITLVILIVSIVLMSRRRSPRSGAPRASGEGS